MFIWIILIVGGFLFLGGIVYFSDDGDMFTISIDKDGLGKTVDDIKEKLPVEIKVKNSDG